VVGGDQQSLNFELHMPMFFGTAAASTTTASASTWQRRLFWQIVDPVGGHRRHAYRVALTRLAGGTPTAAAIEHQHKAIAVHLREKGG